MQEFWHDYILIDWLPLGFSNVFRFSSYFKRFRSLLSVTLKHSWTFAVECRWLKSTTCRLFWIQMLNHHHKAHGNQFHKSCGRMHCYLIIDHQNKSIIGRRQCSGIVLNWTELKTIYLTEVNNATLPNETNSIE